MKQWNFFLIIGLFSMFTQQGFAQDGSTPPEIDEERVLDEVEVNESNRRRRRQPTTGKLIFEPLPVRMAGSPPIWQHRALELILRPVRIREDGIYEFDDAKGSSFTSVNVELSIGKVIVGSRLPLAKNGKRTVDLPEAIYAISEVRYTVFNQVGRAFDPDDPFGNPIPIIEEDFRYCLADRTIAFDIKNGQSTDIGRLIIRALERRFQKSSREHRPILGADADFLPVSAPSFRNKAPEVASAGVIEFEDSKSLCRDSSIRAPGWFTQEELGQALPSFSERLEAEDKDS